MTQKIPMIHRDDCRLCRKKNLRLFLNLGSMPHAGAFCKPDELDGELSFPLIVYVCEDCHAVQLIDVIPPEYLFKSYRYLSSATATGRAHFASYAVEVVRDFMPDSSDISVEIGSNDGVLQLPMEKLGRKAIGVEPSVNVSQLAKDAGLTVINDFFTQAVAKQISLRFGRAKVVLANNVFAHIDDLDEVMHGVDAVMRDDGVFIIEVHYLLDLIRSLQYDAIYHEHLCYHSVLALQPFFRRFGMELFDVRPISLHAGSIRLFVKRVSNAGLPVAPSVARFIEMERDAGLDSLDTFTRFSKKVHDHKLRLKSWLVQLKSDGKHLAGYGAPGRGNTLLNYCGIRTDLLDFIVDGSPERQGRLTPGTHIPIVDPNSVKSTPDIFLMLAWSYKDEILGKEKSFLASGGRFLVPLPDPVMLDSTSASAALPKNG